MRTLCDIITACPHNIAYTIVFLICCVMAVCFLCMMHTRYGGRPTPVPTAMPITGLLLSISVIAYTVTGFHMKHDAYVIGPEDRITVDASHEKVSTWINADGIGHPIALHAGSAKDQTAEIRDMQGSDWTIRLETATGLFPGRETLVSVSTVENKEDTS